MAKSVRFGMSIQRRLERSKTPEGMSRRNSAVYLVTVASLREFLRCQEHRLSGIHRDLVIFWPVNVSLGVPFKSCIFEDSPRLYQVELVDVNHAINFLPRNVGVVPELICRRDEPCSWVALAL